MPRYYFHLSFGTRFLPDEEGVELANRAAAHEDARLVVSDLVVRSDAEALAGWFLHVADEEEEFLRVPIGRPALELVVNTDAAAPDPRQELERRRHHAGRLGRPEPAELGREALCREAVALHVRARQLGDELYAEMCRAKQNLTEARHLLARV